MHQQGKNSSLAQEVPLQDAPALPTMWPTEWAADWAASARLLVPSRGGIPGVPRSGHQHHEWSHVLRSSPRSAPRLESSREGRWDRVRGAAEGWGGCPCHSRAKELEKKNMWAPAPTLKHRKIRKAPQLDPSEELPYIMYRLKVQHVAV